LNTDAQFDTRGDCTAGGPNFCPYTGGDSCDGDDDGDKVFDYGEFAYGGQPKTKTRWDSGNFGADLNGDTTVGATDSANFLGGGAGPGAVPQP
jgi:hypothetical protein